MNFSILCIRFAGLLAGASLASACATPAPPVFDHAATVAQVRSLDDAAARIRTDVAYLADDAMEGREAGTRGYDAAADYVAARMTALGLSPGNGNSWFQEVELRTASSMPDASAMSIENANGDVTTLTFLEDFKIFPSLEEIEVSFSAPAVFVGYGVHAPALGHDDFAGLDIEGKVVVRFPGAPDSFPSDARAHYGSSQAKTEYIASRGAVATIGLYTDSSEKLFPWRRAMRNRVATATSWVRPNGLADVSGPGLKGSISLNPERAQLLFDGAPKTYRALREEQAQAGAAPRGFDLPVTIAASGAATFEDLQSRNVIGVIEGADPALKNEALVITAHLDHVGIDDGPRRGQDVINNGAMDNALGVAMLLETAKRFLEGAPPARTIVFVALTAEEKGLLGADQFAQFPTLGDKEIIANVNLDMPLMLHRFTDIVAFGGERSSLGPLIEKALADIDVALSPDPMPEQGLFTRSDHYRFVEQGIPSVFLWPGFANGGEEVIGNFLTTHYHNVSDDMSLPVRWNDAVRFTDVNYVIAREIADGETRPTWNEGDFFGELFTRE